MRDDDHDGGNGHDSTPLPELLERAGPSPVIVVQSSSPPAEGNLSSLAKLLPIVGSLLLGAVVATGAVITKAGCGTSSAYVAEAMARVAAPIPDLAKRVDAVERAALVSETRLTAIMDQLDRIEARLVGKATP